MRLLLLLLCSQAHAIGLCEGLSETFALKAVDAKARRVLLAGRLEWCEEVEKRGSIDERRGWLAVERVQSFEGADLGWTLKTKGAEARRRFEGLGKTAPAPGGSWAPAKGKTEAPCSLRIAESGEEPDDHSFAVSEATLEVLHMGRVIQRVELGQNEGPSPPELGLAWLPQGLAVWVGLATCGGPPPGTFGPDDGGECQATLGYELRWFDAAKLPGCFAAPARQVDLLQSVPTTLAVSSTVRNERDLPSHLFDGRLDTAWNGLTGQLDAWIALRLPPEVKIDALLMTVGYTARDEKVDRFTANQRITKVRISRNGATLREVALDPKKRGLQRIPIGTAGGELRIEVLDTLPGSKPHWQEICVSELKVLGTAPSPGRHTPRVHIGALKPPRLDSHDPTGRKPAGKLTPSLAPKPFESLGVLTTRQEDELGGTLFDHLALKTAKGWIVVPELAERPAERPWEEEGHLEVLTASMSGGWLVIGYTIRKETLHENAFDAEEAGDPEVLDKEVIEERALLLCSPAHCFGPIQLGSGELTEYSGGAGPRTEGTLETPDLRWRVVDDHLGVEETPGKETFYLLTPSD